MMQSMPTHIGKYELISPLGHGGMGTVYKAFHPQLQRFVAIKLLLENAEADPDFIARFQREAMAVAQLRHPHIVQVFDFDVQSSRPYMVMEFVEGETLAQRLTRLQRSGKVMPIEDVVRFFQQLCSAVEYAHKQGTLHRDLKPQNVIINKQEEIILTDFGLAKIMGASALTLTNATVGTPQYMSPEQAQGQPVDVRSDVYSLGVMLYLMLAGKVPFDASTPVAVLMQHVTATPPPIHEVNPQAPEELAQVAMIAMAKDPEQRFRSAGAMAQALIEAAAKSPLGSADASSTSQTQTAAPGEVLVEEMETILPPTIQPQASQQDDQTDNIATILKPASALPLTVPRQNEPAASSDVAIAETILNGPPAPQTPASEKAAPPAIIPPGPEKRRISRGRWALIALVVLLVVATSGVLGFVLLNQPKQPAAASVPVSVGTISFSDSVPQDFSHPANAITGAFTGLTQPTGGATYFAWFCDSDAPGCTLLGPVIVDQAGKASLTKTVVGSWFGTEDAQTTITIKITQEQAEPSAPPAAPSSDVVYSGKLDPAVLLHVRHQLTAFTKATPFDKNMTALDVGFGKDALLLQTLVQHLQNAQKQNDIISFHQTATWLLSLIAGNQTGAPGAAAGDDGFGMGTEAPTCTSGATTTYLPLLIEHACYASKAGGTAALQQVFTLLQQTGADAARSILVVQQLAQSAAQASTVNQVDMTTLTQQAQQVLNDAYNILADSEQMATITLYHS